MKYTLFTVTVLLAVGAAACSNNNSPSTSTTTSSSTTTAASTSTTTSVAARTAFTLSGTVTESKSNGILRFADIEIISGANAGVRFQTDNNGSYSVPNLAAGAFVMRAWAQGYNIKDVPATITNADLRVNIVLDPAPTTTTTVPSGVHANFMWSPNPCTIDQGPVVNCVVDGGLSTGNNLKFHWAYAGKDVFDQVSFNLSLGCGNLLGSGINVSTSVRLTVTDDAGNSDTIDQGVPIMKLNGVCP